MKSTQLSCLICGSADEPTVEHIIPQTLWKRFGLDPDHDDLARYRTTLCQTHNQATSALHRRSEAMRLVATGEPVTTKTLTHLADWATWVTLLLGLANSHGVLRPEEARRLLADRFDGRAGGLPGGIRVYVARVSEYVERTEFVSHMVGAEHNGGKVLDHAGLPVGFSAPAGPITASEAIGLGEVAILVLSRTFSSGPNHSVRLDQAASSVGLELIHPLGRDTPKLIPRAVDMKAVSEVFMPPLFGDDTSLLPAAVRGMVELLVSDGSP